MSFAPKFPIPERILGVGDSGSGKSTVALDIAAKLPDVTVNIVDIIDYSWYPCGGRLNPGGEVGNIIAYPADTLEAARNAIQLASHKASPSDWLVLDRIGPTYEMAQSDYTRIVKGKAYEDLYLEYLTQQVKTGKKGKNPLESSTDWQGIKKSYAAFLGDVARFPGHVYATCGVKGPPQAEYDKQDLADMFGHLGVRPEGHAELVKAFSTVLYFRGRRGKFTFSTLKDRKPRVGEAREYVEDKEWDRFDKQYLWDLAGWRPGR